MYKIFFSSSNLEDEGVKVDSRVSEEKKSPQGNTALEDKTGATLDFEQLSKEELAKKMDALKDLKPASDEPKTTTEEGFAPTPFEYDMSEEVPPEQPIFTNPENPESGQGNQGVEMNSIPTDDLPESVRMQIMEEQNQMREQPPEDLPPPNFEQ